jgi:hypothetical protein
MYLGSDRAGTLGGNDIWASHRQTRLATWPTPTSVSELSASGDESGGSTDGSGLVLAYAQRIDGTGTSDLAIARRSSAAGAWMPTLLGSAVSTQDDDLNPHLSKDGLELWFSTPTQNANLEIFMSKRTDLNLPFPVARRILELSSTSDDTDPWASPDGRTVFFASRRVNGVSQIFMARR